MKLTRKIGVLLLAAWLILYGLTALFSLAFQGLNMGYAATLSWLLFFILMGLSLVVFRYVGTRIYYENPVE